MTFTEVDGRTRLTLLIEAKSEMARDAIIESGMEDGLQDALDLLERLATPCADLGVRRLWSSMPRSSPVDCFQLAYDRSGTGGAVVLLHGWPGDRMDYRDVTPLLNDCTVVVPDLRGFGGSDKHPAPPAEAGGLVSGLSSVEPGRGDPRRAPDERLAVPTTVLWPEHDPLFPSARSDRLAEFFADLALTPLPGVGHFVPLEAPQEVAAAIRAALAGA